MVRSPISHHKSSEALPPLDKPKEVEPESSSSSTESESNSDSGDSSFEREQQKENEEEFKYYSHDPEELFESLKQDAAHRPSDASNKYDHTPEGLRKKLSRKARRNMRRSKKRIGTVKDKPNEKLTRPLDFRRTTTYSRSIYKPKENREYMGEMLKSVNNTNHLFLNPIYDESSKRTGSIRFGSSYYSKGMHKSSAYAGFHNRYPARGIDDLNQEIGSKYPTGMPVDASIDFLSKATEYRNSKQEAKKQYLSEGDPEEAPPTMDSSELPHTINTVPLIPQSKNQDVGNYNK